MSGFFMLILWTFGITAALLLGMFIFFKIPLQYRKHVSSAVWIILWVLYYICSSIEHPESGFQVFLSEARTWVGLSAAALSIVVSINAINKKNSYNDWPAMITLVLFLIWLDEMFKGFKAQTYESIIQKSLYIIPLWCTLVNTVKYCDKYPK